MVAVAAVAGFVVVDALTADDDGPEPRPRVPIAVELQDHETARDPYTEPVGRDTVLALPDSRRSPGTLEGAYAGVRGAAECDREALIVQLAPGSPRTAAWAAAAGVSVEDVAETVRAMTPLLLIDDTVVAIHGWDADAGVDVDGYAMLRAGTAVLVDSTGSPRVKCWSGNPLDRPPHRFDPTFTGEPWSDFLDRGVAATAASPGDEVEEFVVADAVSGIDLFVRPVATAGEQDRDRGTEEPTVTVPAESVPLGPDDPRRGTYEVASIPLLGNDDFCLDPPAPTWEVTVSDDGTEVEILEGDEPWTGALAADGLFVIAKPDDLGVARLVGRLRVTPEGPQLVGRLVSDTAQTLCGWSVVGRPAA